MLLAMPRRVRNFMARYRASYEVARARFGGLVFVAHKPAREVIGGVQMGQNRLLEA